MINNQYPSQIDEEVDGVNFKLLFGVILIVISIFLAIWICYNIYTFYRAPQKIASFNFINEGNVEDLLSFKGVNTSFKISNEIVNYIFPLFLLSLSVKIFSLFLIKGTQLLLKGKDK